MTKARIELEEGRRILVEKQAMVREAAFSYSVSDREREYGLRDSILAILGGSHGSYSDSEVEDTGMGSESTNVQDGDLCAVRPHGHFVSITQVSVGILLIQ